MRNVKYLIEDIREASENLDVSDFIGIKDKEILRYLNDAQERLQAQIVKKSQKVFVKEHIIQCDGSESYELPNDIFLGNKITDVKYRGSNGIYWERLEPDYVANRDLTDRGYPAVYIRLRNKIYLKPQPAFGEIRLTYVYNVPALDLKRAVVDSATIADGVLTALTLKTDEEIDQDILNKRSYLSIVDPHGNLLEAGIKFDPIDASIQPIEQIRLYNGSHQLENSTLASIPEGSIVVSGKKSSTHSEFDETVERYLIGYAVMKMLQRDGSQELMTQAQLVQEMEAEILESYALLSDDILMIPDINGEWDEF